MRAIVVCLVILGFSLALGLGSYYYLTVSTDKMLEQTRELDRLVFNSQWEEADQTLKQIHREWQQKEQIWTLLINHQEIDNIELTLARLENYLKTKSKIQSLGEISALEHWIKHIPEKEAVTLTNIF